MDEATPTLLSPEEKGGWRTEQGGMDGRGGGCVEGEREEEEGRRGTGMRACWGELEGGGG